MLRAGVLMLVFATLGSLCLDIIPKASFTSKKSNVARHFGRFDIGSGKKLMLSKNEDSNVRNPQAGIDDPEGYQSDQPASTAWLELVAANLRQLNPTVYCGGDAMTLRVQGNGMPNFMVKGADGPVSLTQIPENCGFSLTQSPPYAAFTMRYKGCYVTQQGDDHVLSLHLWGIPIKMSCPLAIDTPNVSCLSSGMVTKLGCSSANGLKLKVNGNWDPFIPASRTCGITTESATDGVVLIVPYQSSCWQIKGDKRFLSLLYGNEELILSCPESHDSYPYGHVEIISDQSQEPDVITLTDLSTTTGPASDSEQPQALVTSSPTITSASKTVDMMYNFPQLYYPFGPMPHKPKPNGYLWAYPSKAPTTTTPETIATTSSTVASNPEQPQHPFPQMYYPYGPMLYHHKPRPYGYPWASPPKAPTTDPTTSQTTATTPSTVASNPEQPQHPFPQMYYPYGPMLYHHKPRPYGYPWASPPKAPTTDPTTSQTTATTPSTVASNPEQPQHPFPQMYYPYGPMRFPHKPRPYVYPCTFYPKVPTTSPTTSQTTATTPSTVASNPEQPQNPFPQMYYPYGPMLYQKPMPYRSPWTLPAKVPTTTPTKIALTTIPTTVTVTKLDSVANDPYQSRYPFHHMHSPFGPMHCYHGHTHYFGHPLTFPAKVFPPAPNKRALTTATTPTSMPIAPIVASNPQQPPYLFNQRYSPFGSMLHHPKPMPFDTPWAFPPKAQIAAQKIIAPTTNTSPTNCLNQDKGQ